MNERGGKNYQKKRNPLKLNARLHQTTSPDRQRGHNGKCLAGQIGWRLLKNAELPNGDYYRNQSASLHHATTNAIFGAFE